MTKEKLGHLLVASSIGRVANDTYDAGILHQNSKREERGPKTDLSTVTICS